jgi:hypothetical protein
MVARQVLYYLSHARLPLILGVFQLFPFFLSLVQDSMNLSSNLIFVFYAILLCPLQSVFKTWLNIIIPWGD